MAASLTRFGPVLARNCKKGWQGYKTGSHYVGLPLALGMGGLGFASGYSEARNQEYGLVRSTVCGVMHTPFYAWIGYGIGAIAIPITAALGVGSVAGVVSFEVAENKENDTSTVKAKAGAGRFDYKREPRPEDHELKTPMDITFRPRVGIPPDDE